MVVAVRKNNNFNTTTSITHDPNTNASGGTSTTAWTGHSAGVYISAGVYSIADPNTIDPSSKYANFLIGVKAYITESNSLQ